MMRRVRALMVAWLRAHLGGELVPAAALLAQGSLVAVLSLMVRSDLGTWGFSLFTLALSAGLVALTLLGEFGSLLRHDPAAAWSESLPATALERRIGHALAVLALLAFLSMGVLIPAALFAPSSMSMVERVLLLVAGVGQSVAIGSALLTVQVLFGERAEGVLVLLQTGLVVGAVTGLLNSPAMAPAVAAIETGGEPWPGALSWAPPAWYATLVAPGPPGSSLPGPALLLAATLLALLLFVILPPARSNRSRRSNTMLTWVLSPLRALATRLWVRPAERGSFDLVYDALPLERDFVLRTYPMIGIPLAFLVVGAGGEGGDGLRDLLALLLFTPAVYLPVLLAHVPVSATPDARWLLDSAPIHPAAIENGAIKALAVRFLLPLYALLAFLTLYFAGPFFALRLAIPGALITLISLRLLYPRCALAPPLSTAPDQIEVRHDWTGFLLTLAVVLTIVAIGAQRLVIDVPRAGLLVAVLVGIEWWLGRGPSRVQA
jgi:hypothetical protein